MQQSHHYRTLLQIARRHARRPDEAEDIAQEVMIAAIMAGRANFSLAADRRWMAGAIRKRAAFDARSAARRLNRERQWQAGRASEALPKVPEQIGAFLSALPGSLRVLAALALSGHTRREIAYLLDLPDTALRQRITALKKALKRGGATMPECLPGLDLDLPYGQIRRTLLPALKRHQGAFASHDPDGHLFIVRRSQNQASRQQESEAARGRHA